MFVFSERLLNLRKTYGYTQRYMAKQLNVAQPSYIRYEQVTAEPTQENLVKIADIFDVSVDYLLGRKEL